MEQSQCKHCGTLNEAGRALCSNCQTPLTAYSGELRGEEYRGKLAGQVDRLGGRPPAVTMVSIFLVLAAIGWPLRAVVAAFLKREHLSADGTNYISSAFSAIGPIFISIVCVPIAAVLVWIAWSVYQQRPGSWQFGLGALIAFAAYSLVQLGVSMGWSIFWLAITAVLAVLWFHGSTRAWFGLD